MKINIVNKCDLEPYELLVITNNGDYIVNELSYFDFIEDMTNISVDGNDIFSVICVYDQSNKKYTNQQILNKLERNEK